MENKKNVVERRVYYHDTDHAGVVYYANYFKWFEIGRAELLRQEGISYAALEKNGLIAPVAEAQCTYKTPAVYDETVCITTWIGKIGNSSVHFKYRITKKGSDVLVAEGSTVNVFIDVKKRNPVNVPKEMRVRFSK